MPARRFKAFAAALAPVQPACEASAEELVGEMPWTPEDDDDAGAAAPPPQQPSQQRPDQAPKLRLVWAHDPQRAAEQGAERQARIAELLERAQARVDKLDAQDVGKAFKGRKLSELGAKARLYHEVLDAWLGHIIKVDLRHEHLSWSIDEDRLARARVLDGKLLLLTNVADLKPAEIVQRYKSLADIERGFHVLKCQIEIEPMFHRLPERIRAHGLICLLALVLHRVNAHAAEGQGPSRVA